MEDTMRERGFTLVEVMIAVVIGGILLVIAASWFMTQSQAYRYLNAQGLFRAALHLARERAMTERSSIPLGSVRQGGPFLVSFAVGVDPDTYTSESDPAKPSPPYRSRLETGRPYRVLLQGLMPDDPTSADGKAAMAHSDFWSLNDRICEVTSITTGSASDGSDEIVCRCSSAVKSSNYVDLTTLALTSWPLRLAQSAKARPAVLVNVIPASPGNVLDSDTGLQMGANDFAVLIDKRSRYQDVKKTGQDELRSTVLEYYYNTQKLQRAVTSPITIPNSDTTTQYAIVFNSTGGTLDGALHVVTFSWIESGGGTPMGGARFRILPSGEVR